MVVKTPDQLEDAHIADVIRSIVSLKTREQQRFLQNQIAEKIAPKIEKARLQGRRVDIAKFVTEVLNETSNA